MISAASDSCVVTLEDNNTKRANATVSPVHPVYTFTAIYWNCVPATTQTFRCGLNFSMVKIRTTQQEQYSNMSIMSATRQWAASNSAGSKQPAAYKSIVIWIVFVIVVSAIILIVVVCFVTRKKSAARKMEWEMFSIDSVKTRRPTSDEIIE